MRKNKLKNLWASGKPSINGWMSISSAFGAEVMANQGYDSLTIDIQHGVIDYSGAVNMLQAMAAYPVTPLVRVSWLEPGLIMKVLDAGAYGLICPMINTREQAEKFVSLSHYPPIGNRSFGPTRALYSYGKNYHKEANDEVVCLAMIETSQAMTNLNDIVSTPGLDGVYIGPSDLSIKAVEMALKFDSAINCFCRIVAKSKIRKPKPQSSKSKKISSSSSIITLSGIKSA